MNEQDLKEHALTKQMARLQTREDILRRKQIAQSAPDDDSDQEDQNKAKKAAAAGGAGAASASSSSGGSTDEMENMLEGTEKVKLEDFELLKVLGRGSFGKVMQVRAKADGNIYAMKILKKRAIIARNQVEHTRAERKILQSLQHPFLMTLRYAFQSKEKLYFVLDYYQGGELFFHLKNNRRFTEEVARIYVGEIALALGHLHSLQIIYRDLKPGQFAASAAAERVGRSSGGGVRQRQIQMPAWSCVSLLTAACLCSVFAPALSPPSLLPFSSPENILLDDMGHVCLTDFGLSKDVDPADKAHTFCGTPEVRSTAGSDTPLQRVGVLLCCALLCLRVGTDRCGCCCALCLPCSTSRRRL